MIEQLLLFEDSKEAILERKIKKLEEKLEKNRKSQFAKISEINKKYDTLKNDYDMLISAMAKCGVKIW